MLLETELGGAQATSTDTDKQLQRAERRSEELQFARDEDKKNKVLMSELTAKLKPISRLRRLRRSRR